MVSTGVLHWTGLRVAATESPLVLRDGPESRETMTCPLYLSLRL
jgi:hypothetical protein